MTIEYGIPIRGT